MEKDRIETLLDKYRRGDITEEERAFLESWYVEYREYGPDSYDAGELLEDSAAVKSRLQGSVLPIKQRKRFLYAAAATAGLVLASGLYLYRGGLYPDELIHRETANRSSAAGISPGGNKATLTLIAGSPGSGSPGSGGNEAAGSIHLSSEKEGIVTDGGKLLYSDGTAIEDRSRPGGAPARYAVLSTPRGGQYQVRLPDGSRVWLNASSTLTYPLSFKGLKERRISLSGEAYFEVAKDAAKPFLVSTQGQTVEVLGTRFNISSYAAEPVVKTTLLEGSLKVTPARQNTGAKNAGRLLTPGQQSAILEGSVTVKQVAVDEAVAWKNGYFQFNNKNLETALVELARWYDVVIEYRNEEIRKQELAGTISRYATISEVLEKMELTGLMHFRVEGRKIIVE